METASLVLAVHYFALNLLCPLSTKNDLVMNPRSETKTLLSERKAWACRGGWPLVTRRPGRWDWDTSFISSLAFVSDARLRKAQSILAIGTMDAVETAARL